MGNLQPPPGMKTVLKPKIYEVVEVPLNHYTSVPIYKGRLDKWNRNLLFADKKLNKIKKMINFNSSMKKLDNNN
mgnify:CR=1 FL=1